MEISIIRVSRLDRIAFRADAEFYRPDYMRLSETLDRINSIAIQRSGASLDCSAFYPSIVPHYNLERKGIPFLQVKEIQNGLLSLSDNTVFLPAEVLSGNRSTIAVCMPGDLIIAKGWNSLAKVALLTEEYPEYSVCRDLIVLRTRSLAGINPYYLWMFLHSNIGQQLLLRTASQTGQPHLTLEAIAQIKVPLISTENQEYCEFAYRESQRLQLESNNAYTQAQQCLESELGLDKLCFEKPLGYTASFSDLEASRRFDPEHYFPEFASFNKSLPNGISLSPLSNHLTFSQRGKQPAYAQSGLPVINSKHVQLNRVLLDDNRFAAPSPDENLHIRYGDTLLNGTGRGTLGRAAPYLTDGTAVPDNHVTILRSTDLDPVYLSLYLNSAAGQMQVEMHQRGTSGQLELYPFDIRKFLIWPAPNEFQQQLRELHDKAAAAELESKRLLEQAKTRIEQLIEETAAG